MCISVFVKKENHRKAVEQWMRGCGYTARPLPSRSPPLSSWFPTFSCHQEFVASNSKELLGKHICCFGNCPVWSNCTLIASGDQRHNKAKKRRNENEESRKGEKEKNSLRLKIFTYGGVININKLLLTTLHEPLAVKKQPLHRTNWKRIDKSRRHQETPYPTSSLRPPRFFTSNDRKPKIESQQITAAKKSPKFFGRKTFNNF